MNECFEATIHRDKVGVTPSCAGIVAIKDGRIMMIWVAWLESARGDPSSTRPVVANYSDDGGRTWTEPVPLKLENGEDLMGAECPQLVRLPSGALGMALRSDVEQGEQYLDMFERNTFHVSKDEGQTWSQGVPINPKSVYTHSEFTVVDGVKCLSDGRLVMAFYKVMGPTPAEAKLVVGNLFGEPLHAGWANKVDFSFVYYSDDEGQSWHRSRNEVHASVEGGIGGGFSMSEPQVAELDDGRLILMALTPLGRLFRSYSMDRGESWLGAEPTDLAVRGGGCFSLKRIPGTSDLLIIWCQLSRFEAMQGLFRHRLSCAVSEDGGHSWQHHKNLASLDDTTCIDPGPMVHWLSGSRLRQPLDRQRYHRAPGPLRNDHPCCMFNNGEAIIVHSRDTLGERSIIEKTYGMDYDTVGSKFGFEPNPLDPNKVLGSHMVHVVPIDWFYS